MIRTLILISLFSISFVSSQNIGIVYNINPKMGFAVNNAEFFNSGIFAKKALYEQDTSYNFINFIESYFNKKSGNAQVFNDFNFTQLKYIINNKDLKYFNYKGELENKIDELINNPDGLEYIHKYCIENKIDELIIITKNYAYVPDEPMETFKTFEHDFGIVSHKKFWHKALLYGNFYIFSYNIKTNKIEKKLIIIVYIFLKDLKIDFSVKKLMSF